MSASLVGTIGTVGQGASAAAYTPTWGTSENRTAGNLLVCWAGGWSSGATATNAATPAGWSVAGAAQIAGGSRTMSIFYAIATGGDAAPTLAAATTMTWVAQLGEFSGLSISNPPDQYGTKYAGSSPSVVLLPAADKASGELICYGGTELPGTAATSTMATTGNNWTPVDVTNNATSTTQHYLFGYGITTTNATADQASITFDSATSNLATAVVSFQLYAVPTAFQPRRMPLGV